MSGFGARTSYLRAGRVITTTRYEFVELFFDLVFVFAVTQLSHRLIDAPRRRGRACRRCSCWRAIWWLWIDTTWVTNWLDPDRARSAAC